MVRRGADVVMTDQQKRFCEEYMIDLSQKHAAIRAGYSPKSAEQQSSNLMKHREVRAHIDRLLAERSKRTGINADRVLLELARIGFVRASDVINMDEAVVRDDATNDDLAAIASVKCKTTTMSGENFEKVTEEREIKLHDKIKALEQIGKNLGMWDKKQESDKTVFVVTADPFLKKGEAVAEETDGED